MELYCLTGGCSTEGGGFSHWLDELLQEVQLLDVFTRGSWEVEHTFVRKGYGARLDHIYAMRCIDIESISTVGAPYSDHRAVAVADGLLEIKCGGSRGLGGGSGGSQHYGKS